MKYFEELSDIETQIIRLSSMSSVLRVLSMGAESANVQDVRESFWYVEGSIESIHDELREAFDVLWETISEKETKEIVGGMKKKKMMTNKELP